MHKYLLTENS